MSKLSGNALALKHLFGFMSAKELKKCTFSDLILKIRNNVGLNSFAEERSKFEGWFKVELIDILRKHNYLAVPEKDRIDISFSMTGNNLDTAIELKTINTNYQCKNFNVKDKNRPITKNIKGILDDIIALKKKNIQNRFVVFIVFPTPWLFNHNLNKLQSIQKHRWDKHIQKVENKLSEPLEEVKFRFNNGVPAIIYYGKI